MELNLNIGAKIKAVANRKGISTKDLADKIPMTRQAMDKVLRKKFIDTKLLFSISKALNFDFLKYCSDKFKGDYLAGVEAMMLGPTTVSEPEEYKANPLLDSLIECRKEKQIIEERYKIQTENAANQQKYIKLLEEKLDNIEKAKVQ